MTASDRPEKKSLRVSLKNLYETMAISLPTVVDAARGRVTKEACDDRLVEWSKRCLANAGVEVEVIGRENIDPKVTYLVMSNHQSIYDIPVLFHVMGGALRMVAKIELFSVPVFGPAMREAGFVAIDRKNRGLAMESLDVAKKALGRGVHIWISPEGTRSGDGMLPFKKGAFGLALQTGLPVLPVTLDGTRDVLRPRMWKSNLGKKVRAVVHPPIDPAPYIAMEGKAGRDKLMVDVRAAFARGFAKPDRPK